MAVRATGANLVIAIVLVVLGALILLGSIGIGELISYLGAILIILGVLMLLNAVTGGTLLGVVLLVLGILMALDVVGLPRNIANILDLIVGVVLVVLGVLKLMGR